MDLLEPKFLQGCKIRNQHSTALQIYQIARARRQYSRDSSKPTWLLMGEAMLIVPRASRSWEEDFAGPPPPG